MQEVTTRWWSISAMLQSLAEIKTPVTLALSHSDNTSLILDQRQFQRIEEIITLLKAFKVRSDNLGSESDVIIPLILLTFTAI